MMIWIVISLVTGLGLLATWLGLRGRRVNDHPICRKCKFDLVGVYVPNNEIHGGTGVSPVKANEDSPRCPECGRDLNTKRAVRIGARRKRPFVLTSGAFLLLIAIAIGGAWGWGRASNFNWNTIKPTWLLMIEATGLDPDIAHAALGELIVRENANNLSDEHLAALAATGLERMKQKPNVWVVGYGFAVERAWTRDLMTEEDIETYARHALRMELGAGAPVWRSSSGLHVGGSAEIFTSTGIPLHVNMLAQAGVSSRLFAVCEVERVAIDNEPIPIDVNRIWNVHIAGSGGGSIGFGAPVPVDPGNHELSIDVRVDVYEVPQPIGFMLRGAFDTNPPPNAIHRGDYVERLRRTVTVLPDEARNISFVTDDGAGVRESLELVSPTATITGATCTVTFDLKVSSPPLDLAFDVFYVAANGDEIKLGDWTARSDSGSGASFNRPDLDIGNPTGASILFRFNRELAIRTPRLERVWQGDILLDDIVWSIATMDESVDQSAEQSRQVEQE